MIYAVFGVPGSGKSYITVKEFIIDRLETFTIIGNIALAKGVDLDGYKYLTKEELNILNLNIKNIMQNIAFSHDEKKQQLRDLFNKYDKVNNITLIVDECHLYGYRGRSSSDSWADDFLSIHRHILGDDRVFDIVLITQVPSRLNSEIANQVEVAIKAIPSSQRVSRSVLEYKFFSSVEALKKNDKALQLKSKMVKADKNIFSLYQSGHNIEGDNSFRKKIFLIFLGIFLLSSYVVYSFKTATTPQKYTEKKHISQDKKQAKTIEKHKTTEPTKTIKKTDLNNSDQYFIACTTMTKKVNNPANYFKNYLFSYMDGDIFKVCYKKFY